MKSDLFVTFGAESIDTVMERIVSDDSGFLMLFYGADVDFREIGKAALAAKVPFIGCMDAGRLVDGTYMLDEKSVVGMSVSKRAIEKITVYTVDLAAAGSDDRIRDLSRDSLQKAAAGLGIDLSNPDMEREVAINLVYGLLSANPYIEGQSRAGLMLQTVGGSSGGKTDFRITNVISSAGSGRVGATALIRFAQGYKFVVDRVSSFDRVEGDPLAVTRLAGPRDIAELNGRPAATVFAEAVGVEPQKLSADSFADYTLGIEPGDDERLVTSIMARDDHEGLLTYNDVVIGTRFHLFKAKSQKGDRTAAYRHLSGKKVVAFVSFDCILCYLARSTHGEVASIADMYERVFAGIPKIGFGTFSENICGANINQTETYLAVYEA